MKLLKVRELAKWLRCSNSTAYGLLASGEIHSVRIGVGNGGIRVPVEAVREFLTRRQKETPEPSGTRRFRHLS